MKGMMITTVVVLIGLIYYVTADSPRQPRVQGCYGECYEKHIEIYGSDNVDRLTGKHETSDINTFSSGVADRGCSIRIPRSTVANGCGYFEDRRPSSSADMYLVTSKITETCLAD